MFDVFAEIDQKLPHFKPRIKIVDQTEIKKLKRNPVGKLPLNNVNYYFRKHIAEDIYLGEGVIKSVENFVNDFAEGRLKHDYYSEPIHYSTKVKQITSK